jgi:hypothetical protein
MTLPFLNSFLMSLGGGGEGEGGGRARVSLLHPFDLIVVKFTHSTLCICIGIAEHAVQWGSEN